MRHSLRVITMKCLKTDIRQQDDQRLFMLGHNTFDFALNPTLRTFHAHGGPHPPKKPIPRRIITTLPATETTTKYIFANPSDESDATLNPMLIPSIIVLTLLGLGSAYWIGRRA